MSGLCLVFRRHLEPGGLSRLDFEATKLKNIFCQKNEAERHEYARTTFRNKNRGAIVS